MIMTCLFWKSKFLLCYMLEETVVLYSELRSKSAVIWTTMQIVWSNLSNHLHSIPISLWRLNFCCRSQTFSKPHLPFRLRTQTQNEMKYKLFCTVNLFWAFKLLQCVSYSPNYSCMQRNASPSAPEPTGIELGYPAWLKKNQQKHLFKDYVI